MARKQNDHRLEARRASRPAQPEIDDGAPRGRKHRCTACGVAFYDLGRDLSTCPKCATPYAAAPHMRAGEPARKRAPWSRSGRRVEPSVETETPVATNDDDDGSVPILDEDAATIEEGEGKDAAEDGNADAPREREGPQSDQV
jgi:predicted  nucleic acid-binding Zn-ribbon protein